MTNAAGTRPEQLRDRMVDRIRTAGHLRSPRVEHALRTVPRHRFVPEASTEDAYADKAITIKPGTDRPASCISVPTVVAMMLDQLDPQPGERILEIGAGTGYNAALLAELVGPEGRVTTVDIHSDVVDHARRTLAETGYSRVRVVNADGVLGYPQDAPYDRIIVTVGPAPGLVRPTPRRRAPCGAAALAGPVPQYRLHPLRRQAACHRQSALRIHPHGREQRR
jgi:protein-L-isoaspartate(D-aspartate) O-methyltransferase